MKLDDVTDVGGGLRYLTVFLSELSIHAGWLYPHGIQMSSIRRKMNEGMQRVVQRIVASGEDQSLEEEAAVEMLLKQKFALETGYGWSGKKVEEESSLG